MNQDDKIDKIYDFIVKLEEKIPNLVTRLECFEKHTKTEKRVDKIYISATAISATISGIFAFSGVVIGFILKAKGIF